MYIFQTVSYFFVATVKYWQLLLIKPYFLVLKKYFTEKISQIRVETIKLIDVFKNYSEKSNPLEIIPVTVKNFAHFFCITNKILECDKLYLFLFRDEIQTDKKVPTKHRNHLKDLTNVKTQVVCTDEQIQKKCLSV